MARKCKCINYRVIPLLTSCLIGKGVFAILSISHAGIVSVVRNG